MRKRSALSTDALSLTLAGTGQFTARLRHNALVAACSPLIWLALSTQSAYGQAVASKASQQSYKDLIQNTCEQCHNLDDYAGGISFDTLDLDHVPGNAEIWEKAIVKLRGRLMPPAGQAQPSQAQVDASVSYLETTLDAAANHQHVGHVPIQRLNRTEFTTAVKGLIGVDLDPKQVLPTEIEVEGFNNIAGALGISPSFMEQYLSAARHAAQLAIGEPVPKLAKTFYRDTGGQQAQRNYRDGFPLGTRGGMSFTHVFPADGEYHFNFMDGDSIDAGLYPRGMETAATLVFLVDGKEVARKEIGGPDDLALADRDGPKGREAITAKLSGTTAKIKAGAHQITATFIERSRAESNETTGSGRVSGMPIIRDGLEVEGPFAPTGLSMSESRAKIFVCQPKEKAEERPCAENIAQNLAVRAFRRPVTKADLDWLMPFYEAGRAEAGGFDAGVTELVTAILSSPDFLYRDIATSPKAGESRALNDLELASRLSFFLWSQGPDEELLTLATNKKLSDPAVMNAQVVRMLKDDRAQALIENFALAWLNLDELEQVEPSDPTFNASMRSNFEKEIRLFLSSVLLENRNVTDLLNADYTFLNEALAKQYDIPGILGPQFRRVTLTNENRFGLLGKGAVLLRTSYGDRTSPVLRGAWILERIMGTPPTPPPPNVNTDLSIKEGEAPTTVRARLEKHRENPICQGCHGLIDPPGLALENFDVTGRWREVDGVAKAKIDSTTVLTSGVVMHGPADLRRHLSSHPEQFPLTVTEKLMMYALNREVEYFDMPQIREIVQKAATKNYTFASLINGIVNSDAFRRQGPETSKNDKSATKVATTTTTTPNTTNKNVQELALTNVSQQP